MDRNIRKEQIMELIQAIIMLIVITLSLAGICQIVESIMEFMGQNKDED